MKIAVAMFSFLVFFSTARSQDLIEAAAQWKPDTALAQVKHLLEKGSNVNVRASLETSQKIFGLPGATALTIAADRNNTELVKLLLMNGADVNLATDSTATEVALETERYGKPSRGATALMYAAKNGNLEMTKLLILNHAHVNSRTPTGLTPLQFNCIAPVYKAWNDSLMKKVQEEADNRNEIHVLLVSNGADVNAKDQSDVSVLMRASMNGYQRIVQLLLDEGADINSRSRAGVTALLFGACDASSGIGRIEIIISLLERGADVNTTSNGGQTPLMMNAMIWSRYPRSEMASVHLRVADLLLAKGSDVNAQDSLGRTALGIALSRNGINELADSLKRMGASLSDREMLADAAKNNNLKILRGLLKKGVPPNAVDAEDQTALYRACEKGHVKIVEALLEKKADVNKRTYYSPLMTASENGYLKIVSALLENGADPNITVKNDYGTHTALTLALKKNHSEIVELLKKNGAADPTIYHSHWGNFSVKTPAKMIGAKMQDYDDGSSNTGVTFTDDFGNLRRLDCFRISKEILATLEGTALAIVSQLENRDSLKTIYMRFFNEVVMQRMFVPTSSESKIIHEEFALLGSMPVLYSIVSMPGGGTMTTQSGDDLLQHKEPKRDDAYRAVFIFSREHNIYVLHTLTNFSGGGALSKASYPLESVIKEMRIDLEAFFHSIEFR